MTKKYIYDNERDLEGLKWTARVVDFGVGLMVASAINEMYNTYALLVERKSLLKGRTKYCCNNAFKEARQTEYKIKENMCDKQFWLDYSDTVIDEAATDITLFRLSIKQTLDSGKISDSILLSYVETTRVMLFMSIEQYKSIMEQAKEKYGKDYSKVFMEYRLDKALYWWEQMCDILYKGNKFDLNNKNTDGMFDRRCKKFAEGEYIQACLAKASENNPGFTENKVNVID